MKLSINCHVQSSIQSKTKKIDHIQQHTSDLLYREEIETPQGIVF